ncbi:hypothetical protein RUM44_012402 [Polyplax serrata]|uniref:Homeobox domain-containing protein n=1 Tax=Polyplax serrata TaxID=468196 RepID=A0ABR1BDB8_POLSC
MEERGDEGSRGEEEECPANLLDLIYSSILPSINLTAVIFLTVTIVVMNHHKPTTAKTAIKGRQLEILKAAFESSPKPTRQIREQLSKDTELPMKVIQRLPPNASVWLP